MLSFLFKLVSTLEGKRNQLIISNCISHELVIFLLTTKIGFTKSSFQSLFLFTLALDEEATQLKRKVQRFSSALLPNITACAQSNIRTYSCICFCTCTFQLGRKQGHTSSCQFSRSPKLNQGQTSATTAIVRRLERGSTKQNKRKVNS